MKNLIILLLVLSVSNAIAQGKGKGKDKDSKTEQAIKQAVTEEILGGDVKGKGGLKLDKGGKPLSPGAHGRANAEYKKATNPGQGAGKNSSLEGAIIGELLSDDDKDEKGKKGEVKKNAKKKN